MKPTKIRIRGTDDLEAGLERFWATLVERLSDPEAPAWDALVVFLYEGGGLIAYPARCVLPFRYPARRGESSFEREHLEGREDWGVLLYAAAEAPRPGELDDFVLDDVAHERAHAAHLARRVELLRASAERASALRAIVDAPRHGAHWVYEAEAIYEVLLRPLVGPPLPPPRTPTTCLEVFARLLTAKGSAVFEEHTGLTWRGDDLVGVELAGPDVTDEVLDLLGEVPRLAELCGSLERLDLRATAVTEPALARARARLPHVLISRPTSGWSRLAH